MQAASSRCGACVCVACPPVMDSGEQTTREQNFKKTQHVNKTVCALWMGEGVGEGSRVCTEDGEAVRLTGTGPWPCRALRHGALRGGAVCLLGSGSDA